MRIAVMALAVLACFACKDKPAPKPKAESRQREAQQPPTPPTLETPDVAGPGLVPAVGLGPRVTMTKTELKVDDKPVATIGPDGLIERSRFDILTRVLESKANSDAPIGLTLDATIEYQRVGQLLDVLRRAGFRNLGLLTGTGTQMIPIELPESSELGNARGVRPVVTLDQTRLILWSASGEEGTKRKPKLAMQVIAGTSFAPVTRALAEIVQRRWPDGKRSPDELAIIVQLDGKQTAQTMLQLLAAVRADGTLVLFPNIFLAGGT